MKHSILMSVVMMACAGCADLNTINRTTGLPGDGKAVHLDAPQRVVLTNNSGFSCAEPSPDALQAYAAALGASYSTSSEQAEIASSLATSASGIGLRTQSITMMRDMLYRICEAGYNKQIKPGDTVQLLQRSQDLSLGVMAIEQLTGAVVAQQPMMTASANVQSADNAKNIQKSLDEAKKDQAAKKTTLDEATKDKDKKQATVDATSKLELAAKVEAAATLVAIDMKTKELSAAETELEKVSTPLLEARTKEAIQKANIETLEKKLAEDLKKDPAHDKTAQEAEITKERTALTPLTDETTKRLAAYNEQHAKVEKLTAIIQNLHEDPKQKAYDTVAGLLKTQQADLDKAKATLTAAQTSVDQSQKVVDAIQKNLDAAVDNRQTVANGAGSFTTANTRNNIDKETVDRIATATERIVESVMTKGRLTDTCINFMSSYFGRDTRDPMDPSYQNLWRQCEKVIEATVDVYRQNGGPNPLVIPSINITLQNPQATPATPAAPAAPQAAPAAPPTFVVPPIVIGPPPNGGRKPWPPVLVTPPEIR